MSAQPSREEELFNAAIELSSPQECAAFLDRECAGDATLRANVEALLRASGGPGVDFLDAPAGNISPPSARGTIALGGTIALEDEAAPAKSDLACEGYTVGAEIARGGMGSILEAQDRKLGRKVAMKVMRLEASASEAARARFVREATVLARLEHPNIVPIHDLGWDAENRLYYTMKLVQGRTLQSVLNGLQRGDADFLRHYTLDRLLIIFRKVCDALALAHARGIVHRDLKPENIMVGEFGEVLVMDWGIAKILGDKQQLAEESAQRAEATQPGTAEKFRALVKEELGKGSAVLTMDGTVMGTPHYMSPEQAGGRVTEIDAQSDVFSLGGILYALLTLHPPVTADSPYDVIEMIQRGEINPPTIYNQPAAGANAEADAKKLQPLPHCPNGKVPTALSAVTMRALAVDKSQRYPDVMALAADIEAYQGGFATSAEDASLFKQIALLIRRNRREFMVGAGAFLVLMAFTVWFVINLRISERKAVTEKNRATAAEKVAVEKGEVARRALAKAQIALADSAARNADLPGLVQALEACPPDLRDHTWQYLSAKRDSTQRSVEFSELPNPTAVLAVPGRPGQFVLAGQFGKVVVVDVAKGDRVIRTFATSTRGQKTLAISGDGRVLAVAGNNNKSQSQTVMLFDVGSGAMRKQLTAPVDPDALALNHEGTRLAVAATGQGTRDGCAVLDSSDGRVLWRYRKRVGQIDFTRDGNRLVVSSSGSRRQVNLLRADNGEEIAHFDANVSCQALSADGKWIAVGTLQGECYLLDAATGAVLSMGRPHNGGIYAITFTADNLLLTSGDEGKFHDNRWVFRLLEPQKLTTMGVFFGLQPGQPTPWSLHPASGDLLTAESPSRLWRLPVGQENIKITHRAEQAWGGCFISDTTMVARKDFALTRYDLTTPDRAVEIGESARHRVVASHWASKTYVVGSPGVRLGQEIGQDLKVFTLEAGSAVEKRSLEFQGRLPNLAFDASGERLVAVSGNTPLTVFDIKSGRSLLKLPGKFERAVFAGAEKNLIALARWERLAAEVEDVLMALDGTTGATLRSVTNHFRVNALAVSADGKVVAIAGSDQMVHLLDAITLAEKASFRAHDGEITALAFHPTRPVIATAAMDRTVKLWEYDSARLVEQFLGLGGTPIVLAFNPSGRLLLVDGQEHTTRVFDVGRAAPAVSAR